MDGDIPQATPDRVGSFTTDLDLVVQSWDAWLERHTGIPAATAVGASLKTLIPDLAPRNLLPRFQAAVAQGEVTLLDAQDQPYLLRCPPVAPSPRFATMQQQVTIAPLRADEHIVGTIVTIEDVTERLDRERDLAAQLRDPDDSVRLQAAEALAATGEHEPGLLTDLLGDQQWHVRRAAVRGLADRAGPRVVADVLRAMREEHQDLARLNSALQVLAQTNVDVVAPLIDFLQDQDTDLRIYAALALGAQPDPRSVAPLIAALADPDPNIRFQAIETLGRLRAVEAVEPLLALATSGDFFLAFAAIESLRAIGDQRIAPWLVPLLADEVLRDAVAEALGTLGDESAVAPLVTLLDAPDTPTTIIARALVRLYERLELEFGVGQMIAEQVRDLLTPTGKSRLLEALDAAASDEQRSLAVVLSWLEGPAILQALARLLADPALRPAMIEALVRFGAGATGVLVAQLAAEDVETRAAAVIALGQIGDRRVVPELIQVLETEPDLAVVAADALAKIGDHRAFDALLRRIGDTDVAVRQAAISALNSLGHPQLEVRVAELLRDPDPIIRESALRIAGYFGYDSCRAAIVACVEDPAESVRQAAVEALPYLDEPRSLALLLHVLHHDRPNVRAAAARALGNMDDAEALAALLGALDDSHLWVRYFAARSLGRQADPAVLPRLIRLLETTEAGPVRSAAAAAIGRIGGEQAAQTLAPLTTAPDADLARAALHALGQTRHPAALPPILAVLQAEASWHRMAAVEALALHGGAGVVPVLKAIAADSDPELRQAAIEALGRIETAQALAVLIDLALDPCLRPAALAALTRRGASALGDLQRGLADPNPAIRAAVVAILARLKLPAADELVIAALDDADPTVRVAAVTAIGRLGQHHVAHKLADLARADPEADVRRVAQALLRR